MKIRAINEEIPQEKNIVDIKNEIPTIRKTFDIICAKFQDANPEEAKKELQDLVCKIDLEIVVWERSKSSEFKLLKRLKFACLNMLVRLTQLDEKAEYILQALDIKPDYVSLWLTLGLETYARGRWISAINAFSEVSTLNPTHPIAIKYRCLIQSMFMNILSAVSIVEQTFELAKNTLLATNLLVFLKHAFKEYSIIEKIDDMIVKYRVKQEAVNNINDEVKWLLTEYEKSFIYVPLPPEPKSKLFNLIDINTLNLSSLNETFDSFFYILKNNLEVNFEPITYEINIPQKSATVDCTTLESSVLPKRTEKNADDYDGEGLIISLSHVISRVCDLKFNSSTTFQSSGICTFMVIDDISVNFLNIKGKIENYIEKDRDLMGLFLCFLGQLVLEFPLYNWDVDLCLKFSHIFVHIRGRYMTQLHYYDRVQFLIFLRYIEIYYLILQGITIPDDLKPEYDLAATKSVYIVREHMYKNLLKIEPSYEILSRVLYILSFTCKSAHATDYLYMCKEYLSASITLFSNELLSKYQNIHISLNDIDKLISYYDIESTIQKFYQIYNKKEWEEAVKFYEENFKDGWLDKSSLSFHQIIDFLVLILRSYTFVDIDENNLAKILNILDFIIGIISKKGSVTLDSKIIDNIFRYVVSNINYFPETRTKYVTNLVFLYLVQFFETDVYLAARLFYYLFLCIYRLSKDKERNFRASFFIDFVDVFYFYIVKKKICCTEQLKLILYRILDNLKDLKTFQDTNTPLVKSIDAYMDAMFFCLVGYPSHKKVSKNFDYLKTHPVPEQVILTRNLKMYELAYNYYQPSHDISFSLIADCIKSNVRKSSINMDLFKFLSLIGNRIAEIVKDDDRTTLLDISKRFENCLHGKTRWPCDLLRESTIFCINIKNYFDFRVFYFLSEYCLKTMAATASLRWVLLSVASMRDSYLTWWSCAFYLLFKVEEELCSLKCEDRNLPTEFSKMVMSLIYCYNQSFYYLDEDNVDHKINMLIDYGWFCYNFYLFLEKGYIFSKNKTDFSLKLLKMASSFFQNLVTLTKEIDLNYYCISLKYYYLSRKALGDPEAVVGDILLEGMQVIDRYNEFDKNFLIVFVVLLFELCLILWKSTDPAKVEILQAKVFNYIATLEKFVNKSDPTINITELTGETNTDSLSQLPTQNDADVLSQVDILSQVDESQFSGVKFEFPKDEVLFGSSTHRITALFGMLNCLTHFPSYYKFIVHITSCFQQLSAEHATIFTASFHKLILYFLTGSILPMLKCNSNIISKLFTVISRKQQNQNFVGLFSINSRSNLFRKVWKVNSRFMDDLVAFQSTIFQGASTLAFVLKELKDSNSLLHICSNLAKERNNTYLFEEDRNKLIDICKEEIVSQLEELSKSTDNTIETTDKIILIAHKFCKMPPRITKNRKEQVLQILIHFFTKTVHFSNLSTSSYEPKQILDLATKYAASLENKLSSKS